MSLEVELSMHIGNQMWILSPRSLEFSKGKKNWNFKMKLFGIRERWRKFCGNEEKGKIIIS